MKLFEIQYSYFEEIELPEELEEEFEEGENTQEMIRSMFVGAESFEEALGIAMQILDEYFDNPEDYKIRATKEMLGIDIINWGMDGKPCDCPFCRAERMADEDLMHFECPICKSKLSVADGGWDDIDCPSCKHPIHRDRIIDIGHGKYMVIEIKE